MLHRGLCSGLKCAYEADSLPRSKSRGRGSVHINFPHSLHEVEHTSKWHQGFPQREVLREACECVSKRGVEHSPSVSKAASISPPNLKSCRNPNKVELQHIRIDSFQLSPKFTFPRKPAPVLTCSPCTMTTH